MRRAVRVGTAIAAGGAMIAGAAVVSLPATAATSAAPTVHVVTGNESLAASWTRVPGATRYTFRYSTHKSMSGARTVTVASLHKTVTKLKNGTKYYVTVQPKPTGLTPQSASPSRSRVVGVVPDSGSPYTISPSAVSVTPGGTNQIVVHWSGGGSATKVGVIAGADVNGATHGFDSGWYPATTRTITLTIPSSQRSVLGADSGNPVFVKVVQSNSTAASPAFLLKYSWPKRYKLTPPGKWAMAGAPESSPVSPITVGQYNVQSFGSTASYATANQWAARVPKLAKTIQAAAPDVIGTEEDDTARTDPSCHITHLDTTKCPEQYQALQSALYHGAIPYRIAEQTEANQFAFDESQRYPQDNSVVDSQIFYNPATLSMTASGYISPIRTLGIAWNQSVVGGDRIGSWAKFTILASGRQFIAAAIHLPVGTSATAKATRKAEATALAAYLDGISSVNGTRLPIVLVGDLNADTARESGAAGTVLVKHGYYDTHSVATTYASNMRYSTANDVGPMGGQDQGYPIRPNYHPYVTSRIDYILVKNSPFAWNYRNVIHRLSNGDMDRSYNGSDHNLQTAVVGISDGVPGS